MESLLDNTMEKEKALNQFFKMSAELLTLRPRRERVGVRVWADATEGPRLW